MTEKSQSKDTSKAEGQDAEVAPSTEAVADGSAQDSYKKGLAEMTSALADIKANRASVGADKTEVETIKAEIKAAHTTISTDIATITELKGRVEGLVQNAENKATQIQAEHESLETQLADLKKLQQELQTFLDALTEIKVAAEASKTAADAAAQAIENDKTRFDELKASAETSHTDMTARQTDANNLASQMEPLFNQTKTQYDVLFTDVKDEAGAVTKKSVYTKIQELNKSATKKLEETQAALTDIQTNLATLQTDTKKEIQTFKEETEAKLLALATDTKGRFDGLHKELKDRVESLLPGAGAAGLASTYFEAKSKYGFTPLEISSDEKNPLLKRANHFLKTLMVTLAYYGMFLLPLGGVVYLFAQIIKPLAEHPDQFVNFNINLFLLRLLMTVPLFTISWFGWNSIRLYRQMYEEYNYKQRVMQLYHSFKNEIAENGTEEQKQALLTIMLTAVGAKPDLGMHDQGLKDIVMGVLDKLPSLPGSKPPQA